MNVPLVVGVRRGAFEEALRAVASIDPYADIDGSVTLPRYEVLAVLRRLRDMEAYLPRLGDVLAEKAEE